MNEALSVQAQAVTLTVWQAFNVAQDRWREQQNKKSLRSKDKSNKAQVSRVLQFMNKGTVHCLLRIV